MDRLRSALIAAWFASAGGAVAHGQAAAPAPPENPTTAAKALLGKALFWDEQLSATRTMACGTCHRFDAGGADPRIGIHPGFDGVFGTADDVRGSPGVVATDATGVYQLAAPFPFAAQVTKRRAPSVIDAAFAPALFWDGRADATFEDPQSGAVVATGFAALESQAAGPPVNAQEMAHFGTTWADVAARIATAKPLALALDVPPPLAGFIADRTYPALFRDAFGSADVTPQRIVFALAAYERTLTSSDSPFDRYLEGVDGALTELESEGLAVFDGAGKCFLCHSGPQLTNHGFFNIGVRPAVEDPGRFLVTGVASDFGRFKSPTMRNVALRAPYFHDGSAATLMDVIEFYDRGGDFHEHQSELIEPLGLTAQQKLALAQFLTTATLDPRLATGLPPFDRPTLYSETDRVPSIVAAGTPGTGGVMPRLVALEPPFVGNPSCALALAEGLAAAPAFLFATGSAGSPPLALLPLGVLAGSGSGGYISFAAAIPRDPTLIGTVLRLRGIVVDAGAVGGLATTPTVEFRFFDVP
jgi:cytochrome c peroxidase